MGEASSLRRDIVSAYVASGAKILSWVVVSAIVFRMGGAREFGILVLIRGTLGILNYLSLGLGPALVRLIAEAKAAPDAVETVQPSPAVLSYQRPESASSLRVLYSNGLGFALVTALAGLGVTFGYAVFFRLDIINFRGIVFAIGLGLLLRIISEPGGAVLATHGKIAKDNWLQVEAEIAWMGIFLLLTLQDERLVATYAALSFLIGSSLLLVRRLVAAEAIAGGRSRFDSPIFRDIFRYGGLITLAQLADYFYAPAAYILIEHFMGSEQVAVYAPAVQIDAALLVLVSGMAAVLFPHSAIAHAAGDVAAVRKYYVRGTLASAGILVAGGLAVWVLAPFIFRLWLGDPMQGTQVILPLVLIHTVIGASSMVGRSILLASGKFAPFAISVLITGVTNVVLSYIFVRYLGWGLKGIVAATIVAVSLRCLVWMPWYVMRSLREVKEAPVAVVETPVV